MLVKVQGKETVFFNKFTFHFYYGWIIAAVVFLAEFTTSGMGGSTISLFFEVNLLGYSILKVMMKKINQCVKV